MTEAAILKILFPPDGIVPVDRLERVQSIREHIAALLALSQINNSPKDETRINSQEVSRDTTLRIVKLREQPNANGHRRTWKKVHSSDPASRSASSAAFSRRPVMPAYSSMPLSIFVQLSKLPRGFVDPFGLPATYQALAKVRALARISPRLFLTHSMMSGCLN